MKPLPNGAASQWDVLSRRWRQRKNVQNIGLLIADEIQQVGGEVGPTYDPVCAQTEVKIRIVACGVSLADARDLGEWIGASSHTIFNFPPRFVVLLAISKFLTELNIALDLWTWIFIYRASAFLTSLHS
jgi:hypothetical protein